MSLLRSLTGPADLRALAPEQLPVLAAEIRDALVTSVAKTGGHLGPNLGAVELTIAIHRVFDSPREPVVFDTGHQSYVHKLLTGRLEGFTGLRQRGGLSGYPSRAESEHDWVENSHASTSLSYADGLAKAFAVRGDVRPVVAVIGDGALTGGMAWEALNNIAAAQDRPVVIVVNDNGRSYSPTIGGVADALATLRLRPGYEQALLAVRQSVTRAPVVGTALYDALHAIKKGLKDVLSPQGMFEDLGMKYVGPVDGHDIAVVESALRRARSFGGPVIVHAVTTKGFGYAPAQMRHDRRLARHRRLRPRLRGQPGQRRPGLDDGVLRRAGRGRGRAVRRRGHHRRDAAPHRAGRVRRAVPRARPSTSASPSSTRSPRPRAWRWPACTRSWRSTPPSSTGPSTSC